MSARVLISLAAMTLVAGSVYVAAEGAGPSSEPKSGPPPKAEPKVEPKEKLDPKGKQAQPKPDEGKAKPDPKAKEAPPKTGDKPKTTDPKTADPKAKESAPPKTGEKPAKADPKAAEKAAKGEKTAVTTEQRTEIRTVILKSGNAPRVTNVNFSISVGVNVPRTIRVAVLPPRVVEIYPAWRGYRYFIVGDQIIIIDDGWRIVRRQAQASHQRSESPRGSPSHPPGALRFG
jgi:hypothetical protein